MTFESLGWLVCGPERGRGCGFAWRGIVWTGIGGFDLWPSGGVELQWQAVNGRRDEDAPRGGSLGGLEGRGASPALLPDWARDCQIKALVV